MIKKIVCFNLILLCSLGLIAQNSKAHKDIKTVIKKLGKHTYQSDFTLDYYSAVDNTHAPQSGVFCIQQSAFSFLMGGIQTLYDGKTQWVYMAENNEVTVSQPDAEELVQSSPWEMIQLYFKTHRVAYGDPISNEVTMYYFYPPKKDKDEVEYFRIELDVVNESHLPKRLIIFQKNGDKIRFDWENLEKVATKNIKDFQFDASQYPNVEWNDMR